MLLVCGRANSGGEGEHDGSSDAAGLRVIRDQGGGQGSSRHVSHFVVAGDGDGEDCGGDRAGWGRR